MSVIRLVVAVVLLLLGAVWLGQGVGLIGGSVMTGSAFWAIVGGVLVLVGAWLGIGALRARGRGPAEADSEQ